ncbi:MAG: RNA polymerase sigma factor, partial [Thermoleophilaceae bacterium]
MTPRRLIEPARLAGSSLLRTQTDARLVDLVRAGHASAFEAIVQRYRKPLLAYCSRVLPPARAEDAVQQAFLNAYQAMVLGDAELNLRPWLYRIAHNASLNLLRQNGWTHEQLDDNFDGVERPDQALERREELRTTLEAVKALPERQRDAVVLRELEGMRYDEIAVALGVGDGAVRQLLHRARTTLRAGMSSVIPAGLIERVALAAQSGDPTSRIAEVAGGVGCGLGMVKLGAALLATGVLATGAATAPIVHHSHASRRSAPKASEASAPAPAQTVADRTAASVVHTRHEAATQLDRHRGHGGSGQDRTKGGGRSGSGSG